MRNEKKQISPSRPCFPALLVVEEKEEFLTTTVGQRVYMDASSSSSSFSSLRNRNNSARKQRLCKNMTWYLICCRRDQESVADCHEHNRLVSAPLHFCTLLTSRSVVFSASPPPLSIIVELNRVIRSRAVAASSPLPPSVRPPPPFRCCCMPVRCCFRRCCRLRLKWNGVLRPLARSEQ